MVHVLVTVMYDYEFETKENKISTKDKIYITSLNTYKFFNLEFFENDKPMVILVVK